MKRFTKCLILLLVISISLILLHCSKYKEPAPFFEGLFLEYERGTGDKTIYNIQTLGDDRFKIIEIRKRPPLSDDIEEMYVNKYGKVYKSSFKPYKGKFSPIWIPVHAIEIGDTFDDTMLAERRDKWEQWEVLVVKGTLLGGKWYYDINTGFLVGSFAKTTKGTYKIVLVKTNADIPTVGE